MSWLDWLLGRSRFHTELYGIDVENTAIADRETIVTICLQAQIEEGRRLGFRVSPHPEHKKSVKSGKSLNNRPLSSIAARITDQERLVIRSVVRLHTHSDLSLDLSFELQHPFEHDAATQVIRERRDAALKTRATGGAVTIATKKKSDSPLCNNNNRLSAVRLEQPTDSEDYSSLVDDATDGESVEDPFKGKSARQILGEMDRISLRGGLPQSNEAERENVINLGTVRGLSTSHKEEQVYRASLSDESITWFAGQDHVVADKSGTYHVAPKVAPPPARPVVEGGVAERAAMPTVPFVIMDGDCALISFILRYCGDIPDLQKRMRLLHTDRSGQGTRLYEVDTPLIEEAKEKILYTVYAQMYYTRLEDCIIARRRSVTETCEEGIALKLASEWGLPIDQRTKRISDWSADAYRPVVIITLRVTYAVVSGVYATAASLHKTKTRLVPANE